MMIPGDFRFSPEQNRPYREILLSFDNHKNHGNKARRIWTEVMREMRQTRKEGLLEKGAKGIGQFKKLLESYD